MARLEPITSWYMGRALNHSRNFRSIPENTIKGDTRHYFEPNRFNANLKPHSHLFILFYILIYIAITISLSLSLSLFFSRVFYTLSSFNTNIHLFSTKFMYVSVLVLTLPDEPTAPFMLVDQRVRLLRIHPLRRRAGYQTEKVRVHRRRQILQFGAYALILSSPIVIRN